MLYYSISYFFAELWQLHTKELASFYSYLPPDQSHGMKHFWINGKMANEKRFSPPILKVSDCILQLSGLKWDYLGVWMLDTTLHQVFGMVRNIWRHSVEKTTLKTHLSVKHKNCCHRQLAEVELIVALTSIRKH